MIAAASPSSRATVPDLETLVAFLDEFTTDPRWYRSYRSLLIDSLTQFVDPKVAQLGIDNCRPHRGAGSVQSNRRCAAFVATSLGSPCTA